MIDWNFFTYPLYTSPKDPLPKYANFDSIDCKRINEQ